MSLDQLTFIRDRIFALLYTPKEPVLSYRIIPMAHQDYSNLPPSPQEFID